MIRADRLPERYPKVPLSDLVEFLDHLRKPITAKDREKGPYPYYGANGQQDSVADYLFDEPLILLAEDGGHFGETGKTIAYQVEGKCWVNNHAHVLRTRDNVCIRYLLRHLESYDVSPYVKGATRKKLNKGDAKRIPISFPPLEEQKRIAAILDKADAIRRKREQAIELTDQLLRSVFLDMFGDPVTNPKKWSMRAMDEVCSSVIDCPHSTPNWATEGKICVRTPNLRKGYWDWLDTRYVSPEEFIERSSRGFAEQGDIVLSREGTIGIAAIVEANMEICLGQRLVLAKPNRELIESEYLLRFLLHVLDPTRIVNLMKGATSKHLNVGDLRKFSVPTPPLVLQKEYSEFFLNANQAIAGQNKALGDAIKLMKSLAAEMIA